METGVRVLHGVSSSAGHYNKHNWLCSWLGRVILVTPTSWTIGAPVEEGEKLGGITCSSAGDTPFK